MSFPNAADKNVCSLCSLLRYFGSYLQSTKEPWKARKITRKKNTAAFDGCVDICVSFSNYNGNEKSWFFGCKAIPAPTIKQNRQRGMALWHCFYYLKGGRGKSKPPKKRSNFSTGWLIDIILSVLPSFSFSKMQSYNYDLVWWFLFSKN